MQFFSSSDTPDSNRELYPGAGDISDAEMVEVKGGEEVRLKDIVLGAARLGEIRLHIAGAETDPISEADLVVNGFGDSRSGRAQPFRVSLESGNTLVRVYRPNGPGIFSADLNWRQQDGSMGTVATPIEFTGRDIDVDIAAAKPAGQLEIRTYIDDAQGNPMPASGAGFRICRLHTPCRYNDFAIRPEFGFSLAVPILRSDAGGVLRLTGIAEGSFVLTDAGLAPPERGYVVSATQNGHDVLKEGIVVSKSPSIVEVHFKRGVGRIHGKLADRQGRKLDEGMILLQPEDNVSLQLQYFAEVERTGDYAMGGVRPGRYRAYAWSNARIDQVLDPDFVDRFKGRGIPVTIGENAQVSLDLTILDTP
jgi:hypothetical protein